MKIRQTISDLKSMFIFTARLIFCVIAFNDKFQNPNFKSMSNAK
jgi:hypothetical protein